MSFSKAEADWLTRFTGTDVAIKFTLQEGEKSDSDDKEGALLRQLQKARDKEAIEERKLKDALLQDALSEIEDKKEELRRISQFEVKRTDESGKERIEEIRAKSGDQTEALDTGDMRGVTHFKFDGDKDFKPAKKQDKKIKQSIDSVLGLQAIAKRLAAVNTPRKVIDMKNLTLKDEMQPLFTDKEITAEIFTPLVRDKVIGETLVPSQYSQTQNMLDGSDEHYIKECREKGKKPDTGALALFKGAVTVGAAVATTVIGAMAAPKTGSGEDISQGQDWSKDQVARFTELTNGIAAVLTGGGDVLDQLNETRKNKGFDENKFNGFMSAIGTGVGQLVSAGTGNDSIGGLVAIGIQASSKLAQTTTTLVKWAKSPDGEAPIGALLDALQTALTSTFNGLGDTTSGDTAIKWSDIGNDVGGAMAGVRSAYEHKVLIAIKNGEWREVGKVLADFADAGGKAAAASLQNNPAFNVEAPTYNSDGTVQGSKPSSTPPDKFAVQNEKTSLTIEEGATKNQSTTEGGLDTVGSGIGKMLDLGKGKGAKPLFKTSRETDLEAVKKKFEELKKAKEELEQEDEKANTQMIKDIEEQLAKDDKEYQASLKCLGSKNPDEAEFKSIAKLIEKLEADKALVDGLTAMFGGGIGAASGVTAAVTTMATQVAPALKAAGQLVKFIANCKAAHDRRVAWMKWKEGRKDAASAVSPYATAIDRFAKSQGEQFAHYTIQATANAIQVLLACGEASPFAPAFKAAGGAVAATAALQETLYKFYNARVLASAWKETKVAIDPANKQNRKMRLLARKTNPTLAKYTIAYGALVQEEPIAITALNRCGLDRETLTRAGDKVKDVKTYLEKLYPDDGTVLVTLDLPGGKGAKVPDPALDSKTWALSYEAWAAKGKPILVTKNPPSIVGNLAMLETLTEQIAKLPDPAKLEPTAKEKQEAGAAKLRKQTADALDKLEKAFASFDPKDDEGNPIPAIKSILGLYADLAWADSKAMKAQIPDTTVPLVTNATVNATTSGTTTTQTK